MRKQQHQAYVFRDYLFSYVDKNLVKLRSRAQPPQFNLAEKISAMYKSNDFEYMKDEVHSKWGITLDVRRRRDVTILVRGKRYDIASDTSEFTVPLAYETVPLHRALTETELDQVEEWCAKFVGVTNVVDQYLVAVRDILELCKHKEHFAYVFGQWYSDIGHGWEMPEKKVKPSGFSADQKRTLLEINALILQAKFMPAYDGLHCRPVIVK